jgi:hypothetical protein
MTVAYLAANFEAVSNIFSDPDKFVKRVFEKLTLPLRSRAHLRDYGSHEHPEVVLGPSWASALGTSSSG